MKNFLNKNGVIGLLFKNKIIIFVLLTSVLPIAYMFSLGFSLHRLPNNDYWGTIAVLLTAFENDKTNFLSALLNRSNEHIIAIPLIFHFLNVFVTNGSNVGLFYLAFSIKAVQLYFIYKILTISFDKDKKIYLFLVPIITFFVFSPVAAHNWILSFSGTVWFLANTFVIVGIYYLFKIKEDNYAKPVFFSLFAIILGNFSYSTAMFIFPAIIFYLIITRSKVKLLFPYLISGLIYFVMWLFFYKTPSHHPDMEFNFLQLTKYFLAYLGGIFSNQANTSIVIGLSGLILFLFIISYMLVKRRTQSIGPWVILAFYSILNALAAALARGGFGLETALSSRYASLPILFWASLIVLVYMILNRSVMSSVKLSFGYLIIVGTLIIYPMYSLGITSINNLQKLYSNQEIAELGLAMGIIDEQVLASKVVPWTNQLIPNLQILKLVNHVPFDKEIIPDLSYGKKINFENKARTSEFSSLEGYLDKVTNLENNVVKLSGWAYSSDRSIEYIVITTRKGKVRGAGLLGTQRIDVAKVFGERAQDSGWQGYAKTKEEDKGLVAYAKIKGEETFIKLNGVFMLQN